MSHSLSSHTQLYKAADNSCLATHTHGSRINRACFTTVTTTDTSSSTSSSTPSTTEAGAADWRMVTVCDNKTVNMFDFQGHQVKKQYVHINIYIYIYILRLFSPVL